MPSHKRGRAYPPMWSTTRPLALSSADRWNGHYECRISSRLPLAARVELAGQAGGSEFQEARRRRPGPCPGAGVPRGIG